MELCTSLGCGLAGQAAQAHMSSGLNYRTVPPGAEFRPWSGQHPGVQLLPQAS